MTPAQTQAEQAAFQQGYAAGQGACLMGGSESGWQALREARHMARGYGIGLRQSIWDWEDANGMPHTSPGERGALSA